MNHARLSLVAMAMVTLAFQAQAQTPGPGRLTAGIFGGGTLPSGDFKDEAGNGWHAGGLLKMRIYGALDARLDGAYSKLGKKNIVGTTATVSTDTRVIQGTLDALVNLGSDSAAYPGDNSVSPYVMLGLGRYNLNYDPTCTGTGCTSFEDPGKKTHTGFNVGGGGSIPLLGLRTFVEARYHRMMRRTSEGQSRAFLLVSAGIKLR